jgi:hypothetical protein
MQTETNNIVNKSIFENLLKETPETLAINLTQDKLEAKIKNFSVVDFWNIKKTKKNTQHWRRSFSSF